MANLTINNGGIVINSTDLPNIDLRYGPYKNISEAYRMLGSTITPGLTIGIIEEGGIREYIVNDDNQLTPKLKLKTINDQSITGEGNINIEGITDYSQLSNKPSINGNELNGDIDTSQLGIDIPTKTSDLVNDSGFLTTETEFNSSPAKTITTENITDWNGKQDELTSGTNIKTINNQSILGSGNINIEGITDYSQLSNKPKINNIELGGNVSLSDLGVATESDISQLADKVDKLPTGRYYGQYDSIEELPDQSQLPERGYAYVSSTEPNVYYIYLYNGNGEEWQDSGNKFVTTELESNLTTKSQTKAPTTKAVADGIDSVNLLEGKNLTTSQKYNVSANINDRPVDEVIETGVVKALGYKVLNPELTFASQVQDANTIYEIRDEFDLDPQNINADYTNTGWIDSVVINHKRYYYKSSSKIKIEPSKSPSGKVMLFIDKSSSCLLDENLFAVYDNYYILTQDVYVYLAYEQDTITSYSKEVESTTSTVNCYLEDSQVTISDNIYYLSEGISLENGNKITVKSGFVIINSNNEIVHDKNNSYTATTSVTVKVGRKAISRTISMAASVYTHMVMPINCTLKLNGGKVINGRISGDLDIVASEYDSVKGMFIDGYNIVGRDSVSSLNVGLYANSSSYANFNNRIIQNIINNCKELTLVGKYYITGTRTVSDSFIIDGGTIEFTGDYRKVYFEPLENSELILRNVTIIGNEHELIKTTNQLNYVIKRIEFDNCTVHGTRPVYLQSDDLIYDENPYGLEYFIVKNCKFLDQTRSLFALSNGVVTKQFIVTGNYIDKAVGVSFSCGTDNDYESSGVNKKNQCDFIVENNVFIGRYSKGTSYYCPCLFEVNRVFIRNNIIKDYIMGGTGIAYDSYISSNEYYFEGNTVNNVCNLPMTGKPNSTPSEIFKSKGKGSIRQARNNRWEIDFNDLRTRLASEYDTTFTDEQFTKIASVSIFIFNHPQQSLLFDNNTIIIKGGTLAKNTSSKPVVSARITNNVFTVDDTTGVLIPFWNESVSKLCFNNNVITVSSKKVFSVFSDFSNSSSSLTNINCSSEIRRNVSNVLIPFPTNIQSSIYKENYFTEKVALKNTFYIFQNTNSDIYIDNITLGNIDNSIVVNGTMSNVFISDAGYVSPTQQIGVRSSNRMKIKIPYFNYETVLDFRKVNDDTSWELYDDYGILLDSGDFLSNTDYKTIQFYGMLFRYMVSSTKKALTMQFLKSSGAAADWKVLRPFTIEFLEKNNDVGTWNKGIERYNINNNRQEVFNGTVWQPLVTNNHGGNNTRPTSPLIGEPYFDTTLGKPIYWNGTAWIDGNGDYIFDNSGTLQNRLAITSPVKGQQFKLTGGESDVYLIYGDYGWLNATDRTPWFDDSGELNTMYDKYNYILLTAQPDDWTTKYNTYYKIADGVYTLLTTSETWALDTYYKKDMNAYKGIQVKLTDTDTELLDKVVKWDGTKFINVIDNDALKAGTPKIVFNTENDVTTATITSTSSGKIYYSKDGIDPTSSSTEYSSPITLSSGDQIKAICIRDHVDNSDICFVKVATPSIDFSSTGILSITCDTPDVKIYYTTDGKTPSTSSTEYNPNPSESITIAKGTTVNAFAVLIGRVNSEVATQKRS